MKNLSLSQVDGLLSRIHLLNHVVERVVELLLPKATARAACPPHFCAIVVGAVCYEDCAIHNGACRRFKSYWTYKVHDDDPNCGSATICQTWCGSIQWLGPCVGCPV